MSVPVVLVHGLWIHADAWQPWIAHLRSQGYDPVAPGWPDDPATVEEARAHPDRLAGKGVQDVVDHYAAVIRGLTEPPLLIGHSFGGLVVQKLLGMNLGVAAVAIDAAPIKGVLPLPFSALKASSPVLLNPANRKRAVALTREQFRYAFGNAIPAAESDALWERWTIPGAGRPLFQAASANVNPRSETRVDTANTARGPLLLVGGGRDHTVPLAITRATLKQYRKSSAVTDLEVLPDRGHSLTMDDGWPEVADLALRWFEKSR